MDKSLSCFADIWMVPVGQKQCTIKTLLQIWMRHFITDKIGNMGHTLVSAINSRCNGRKLEMKKPKIPKLDEAKKGANKSRIRSNSKKRNILMLSKKNYESTKTNCRTSLCATGDVNSSSNDTHKVHVVEIETRNVYFIAAILTI